MPHFFFLNLLSLMINTYGIYFLVWLLGVERLYYVHVSISKSWFYNGSQRPVKKRTMKIHFILFPTIKVWNWSPQVKKKKKNLLLSQLWEIVNPLYISIIPCPGWNYSTVASIVINKSYFQVHNKPVQLDSLVENWLQGRNTRECVLGLMPQTKD